MTILDIEAEVKMLDEVGREIIKIFSDRKVNKLTGISTLASLLAYYSKEAKIPLDLVLTTVTLAYLDPVQSKTEPTSPQKCECEDCLAEQKKVN